MGKTRVLAVGATSSWGEVGAFSADFMISSKFSSIHNGDYSKPCDLEMTWYSTLTLLCTALSFEVVAQYAVHINTVHITNLTSPRLISEWL